MLLRDSNILQITETLNSEQTPLTKLPKPQQDLLWTLSSSVLGLLTSLSEAQDEIAEAVSNIAEVVEFMFTVISSTLRYGLIICNSYD